jgi:rhombotail lipoprotein
MSRFIRRHARTLKLLGLAALTLTLSGCGILDGRGCLLHCGKTQRASTPLVRFLYGDEARVPRHDAQVQLQLPIRVGLAFLPPRPGGLNEGPTAVERERILRAIRGNFANLPYVAEIVPVPAYYFEMTRGDGMQQLEQLARLQRLDLMALISYDQRSTTRENRRALAYLTIVGAAIMKGNHNETQTIIDLAVVEPIGRSLVLRAGGISSTANSAAAIDQGHKLQKQQRVGFDLATDNLIANFRTELADFESRVKAGTADIRVVNRARTSGGGNGGSGAFDPLLLAGFAAIWLIRVRLGRRLYGVSPEV